MKRQVHINKILDSLNFLAIKIKSSNSINLTDINIHSENFYRDFLNLLYEYNLENINIEEQNSSAIDLGEKNKKIAIQVTSTTNLKKATKTITAFIKNKLHEKYERLIILIISTNKTKHKNKYIGDVEIYQLDTEEDIWDIKKLITDVHNVKTSKLAALSEFIEVEIGAKNHSIPKEIGTFISLINLLSDETHMSAGSGYIEDPDPDGKIYKRFSNYSQYLTNEYKDLYIEYGQVLQDVMEQIDLGHIRLRRLEFLLKTQSDHILNECGGDPKKALDALVTKYGTIIAGQRVEYDEMAIRFFLVHQLIKCNVFPNKEGIND